MDVVALNPYSRQFFEYLEAHEPGLAAACEVDHSHPWDRGVLKLRVEDVLGVSTLDGEITIFFGPTHLHLDDFATALDTLHQLQSEDLVAAEWLEEEKTLCYTVTAREPLEAPGLIFTGTPTHVRITSYRGTWNTLRAWNALR